MSRPKKKTLAYMAKAECAKMSSQSMPIVSPNEDMAKAKCTKGKCPEVCVQNKGQMLEWMAEAYYDLLVGIVPLLQKNPCIEVGLKEGLNKFLSNLCIKYRGKDETDFYSEKAKEMLDKSSKLKKRPKGLEYEHMVPKEQYIQKVCLDAAKEGKLCVDDIKELLTKYWKIATITKEEHDALSKAGYAGKMPDDWDKIDIFARYDKAGIKLDPPNFGKKNKE